MRRGHSQGIEFVDDLPLVQKAQDYLLPVIGGECRNSDIYGLGSVVEMDAAVLRTPLFGDIHVRHDLEARQDFRYGAQGQFARDFKYAVLAEPDEEVLFAGLEMDVGNAGVHRFGDDFVDEPDDGGA